MLRLLLLLAPLSLGACSPALDWREHRPDGSSLRMQLPCKPASHSRRLSLAGGPVSLLLYACKADGSTWALALADVNDPARVGQALQELRTSALANVQGQVVQAQAWGPPGATPNQQAMRWRSDGHLPDGTAVVQHAAVFAHGTWVFQATVLGPQVGEEAPAQFFSELRVATGGAK
jgi:hypothetical protein